MSTLVQREAGKQFPGPLYAPTMSMTRPVLHAMRQRFLNAGVCRELTPHVPAEQFHALEHAWGSG